MNIIGPLAKLAGTFMDNRQKKAEAKNNLEIAKLEAKTKAAREDASWEDSALQSSANSWKDEAWTICFIAIILASFVPQLQPYMQAGFDFLRSAPDWLQWGILASIAASFGIKSISQFKK